MFIYKDKLESEGFSNTRSLAIAMAVKDLHSAICLLDNRNLNLFWSKTIEERLKEYAESEELNVQCLCRKTNWTPPDYPSKEGCNGCFLDELTKK